MNHPKPSPAAPFSGFLTGKGRPTPVPAQFFTELLPQIDALDELKLTLYVLWNLGQQEGSLRFIRHTDLQADAGLLSALDSQPEMALEKLEQALAATIKRGTLLPAKTKLGRALEDVYFLNSPHGRAAWRALQKGEQFTELKERAPVTLTPERPNIFRLYEENIGPLTPLMAETLADAENEYPLEWIEEAVRTAVHKNVRHWRFVEAVLRSWKEKGRHGTNRQNPEKDRRQYIEGELSEFIDH